MSFIELKATDVALNKVMVGETTGYRDIEVRSRVNGILLKRTYVEGAQVRAGQVLFEIDPEPYKATLDQAKGQLSQEASRLEKARADRNRMTPLFKENAVSRKDYDDALSAYASALASTQTAQASLKQAELNLGYTKVTAHGPNWWTQFNDPALDGLIAAAQANNQNLVIALFSKKTPSQGFLAGVFFKALQNLLAANNFILTITSQETPIKLARITINMKQE
ncbi:MAG: hypothetical protein RL571_1429 [Pseudomonadota bacterium]